MKRFILVVVLSFAVFATGFAQGKNETPVTADGENVITLRWLMQVSTAEEKQQWQELAEDVNKVYPNIKVEMNTTDWNGYWTKLPTEIAGGNPPDILYMQSQRAKDYLGEGFLPISQFIKNDKDINMDDFYKGIIDGLSMNGEYYCLPYDFGPYVLFYNIDQFDKCGMSYPDTWNTWEDFIVACKKMKENGVKCTSVLPGFDRIYSFILGNGANILATDGTVRVNTPEFIAAIQALDDLIEAGYTPLQSDTGNANWDREQFYNGSSAALTDGVWNLTNVKAKSNFKYGVTMVIPGLSYRKTPIAGSGFGISKDTKHPQEAYLALKVLTSKESETKLAKWGRALPARASVRDVYYKQNEDVLGLKESVESSLASEIGITEITPKKWQQVLVTINQNLESVFLSDTKAADALNTAQKEINRILQQ
ncbi:sugar ABC transporter substrate-binding protein [uncultured Sphaerochaeta sp.]|uniref:ABC transporter substrate-binding protein n=1 Tax=uncultured Sphaerochaeta sp. TaxID=886478 RepID=UPI002A0A2D53|nr:sugar ABC transporter substrate-binding protein [uncultured Sphaerochaeta sp.]